MIPKKDVTVETHRGSDKYDPMRFYMVKVRLPQLDLITPQVYTMEHAEEMKDMIQDLVSKCPKCGHKQ